LLIGGIEMAIDRKAAILEAFMNLVRRFGVDKTTMQDVAREGGMSVGVIYKDFSNKDDLIDAYIQKIVQQILFECQQLADRTKPAKELLHDVLIGFCKLVGEYANQDRGFLQCIFGDLQVGQLRQKAFYFEGVFQNKLETMLTAILIKGQTEGQFELRDAAGDMASCLLNAFGIYLYELGIYHKSMDEIIPKAEKMFTFIIRAIEPH
jgi:AcrR family transcriptional regulator